MKKTQNNKGFTLIELMVIIIILGILLSITIPIFTQTKKAMYRMCCTTQQDYLQNQITQYQMGTIQNMYLRYKIVVDKDGNSVIKGTQQEGTFMKWTAGSYDRKSNTWTNGTIHFTDEEMDDYAKSLENGTSDVEEETTSAPGKETPDASNMMKDGTKYYLCYYVKHGKTKVHEIPCATEGERFLRYVYNYGWDEKKDKPKPIDKLKLDTYSNICSINIINTNGSAIVVCNDEYHKKSEVV